MYVAGSFGSRTADFGATTLFNAADGPPDVFVAKLTDAGTTSSFAWAQRAGSTDYDQVNALVVSGTSVYVAGSFSSATASFGATALTNSNPGTPVGFLASLTDPTITATATGAEPREPVTLYPNPTRRMATLHWPVGTTPAPIRLTDAQGRTVHDYPAPAGPSATLDLRGLPTGLYLLRGTGPTQRLIVE